MTFNFSLWRQSFNPGAAGLGFSLALCWIASRILCQRWTRTKQPKAPPGEKWRCLMEVGPPGGAALICMLMACALRPAGWPSTGSRLFQDQPQLPEAGRAGGGLGLQKREGVGCGSFRQRSPSSLPTAVTAPQKVKSKRPELALQAFPGPISGFRSS